MKFYWRWSLLLFTGLTVSGMSIAPSMAQSNSPTLPPPNCKDPQTTRDMIECGRRSYRESDKKLNQIYKQLQEKLGGSQRKRLVTSQDNWLKYRDSACIFEGGMYEGGSLEPPTRINCYARVTNQRLRDLDVWLQELNRR